MINRLYSPWQITNSDEREAESHFALSKGREDELDHIVHQLHIYSCLFKTPILMKCDSVNFTYAAIILWR